MRLDTFDTNQNRFDLRRKDIDPPDDQHVVGATAHTGDTGMGTATDAGLIAQAGNVTRTVANQRNTLLGNGGDNKFTPLPFRQPFPGFRVNDFTLPDTNFGCNFDVFIDYEKYTLRRIFIA